MTVLLSRFEAASAVLTALTPPPVAGPLSQLRPYGVLEVGSIVFPPFPPSRVFVMSVNNSVAVSTPKQVRIAVTSGQLRAD